MRHYGYNAHSKYDMEVHLVWIPKYRKRVLIGQIAVRVRELLRQIAIENEIQQKPGFQRTLLHRSSKKSWKLLTEFIIKQAFNRQRKNMPVKMKVIPIPFISRTNKRHYKLV